MQGCILFVLTAMMLGVVSVASADTTTKELYENHGFRYEEAEMERVAAEDFLIMPWGWTPGNAQVLEDIKDCGFNSAGFVAPEFVKKVRKAGLTCIVDDPTISEHVRNTEMSDEEIDRRVKEGLSKFKGDSAVYGFYVMDEPIAPLFPNLARWYRAIRKVAPEATPYINLLPIGAQGPGSENYEDYLEQFVKVIDPTYISYDHYTLMDDGSIRSSLYTNLMVVREAAFKHDLYFWNIILGNSHFHYAEVTQGGLNLQVYATLAHGGRGISYFTYFAPLIGNYRQAALDQFLNKTSTWDMVRLINMQIHALAPVYLQLKSINVFHNLEVPEGCLGMDTSEHLSEVSGGNFLIGEFNGPDDRPFVLIVNKDAQNSTGFHVKFKQQGTVMMTSPYTGETKPFGGENGWLAPGGGVLLSLEL